MKLASQGYRVAVVGASSLLGQELLTVLEERSFPVSRLIKFEARDDEPDLPVLDLREEFQAAAPYQDVSEQEVDFAFLAAGPQAVPRLRDLPSFLRPADGLPGNTRPRPNGDSGVGPSPTKGPGVGTSAAARGARGEEARCVVIDLGEALTDTPGRILSVPFLEPGRIAPGGLPDERVVPPSGSKFFVSPHPAVILISSLLLRLAARFALERAVAQVFEPVSEIGPRAIDELQKQTVNLLTFQKIPRAVFGDQLAFNLLPRLGRSPAGTLDGIERRLRQQLKEYLSNRAPLPAVRLFQVPVFYSLAVSLYVETARPESPEAIARALGGKPLQVRRLSQLAPSQVEATGSPDILVDTIAQDADHPAGAWIWGVADNMRLAAVNAVEIALRTVTSSK